MVTATHGCMSVVFRDFVKEFDTMELATVKCVGNIIAWFILIVGYILMGMLAYHTIVKAWKGE